MHGRKESVCIKNISQTSGLLDEVEGIVQGHRDGHGFVSRDDGAAARDGPGRRLPARLRRRPRPDSPSAADARAARRQGDDERGILPSAQCRVERDKARTCRRDVALMAGFIAAR